MGADLQPRLTLPLSLLFCRQIEEEARNLAHYTDFRVVSVVGGQSIEDQGFALR